MAFEICEVVPTPNPNAMKFVLDREIAPQPMSFLNSGAAEKHPLAQLLFGINGVTSVLFLGDFVTINKSSAAKWTDIKQNVKRALSESP
jgi:hypothetical protein